MQVTVINAAQNLERVTSLRGPGVFKYIHLSFSGDDKASSVGATDQPNENCLAQIHRPRCIHHGGRNHAHHHLAACLQAIIAVGYDEDQKQSIFHCWNWQSSTEPVSSGEAR